MQTLDTKLVTKREIEREDGQRAILILAVYEFRLDNGHRDQRKIMFSAAGWFHEQNFYTFEPPAWGGEHFADAKYHALIDVLLEQFPVWADQVEVEFMDELKMVVERILED